MAVSKQEILDFLSANPNMSDAEIASAMQQYGVSPAQMASATGLSIGEVTARLGKLGNPDQAVLYGDTYVQPVYDSSGSGENFVQGNLQNVLSYKADENKVGGNIVQYDPSGNYEQTTQQQKVASFAGGLGEMLNDPFIQTALLTMGVGGGLGSALGLTGSTAQAVGTGLFKGGSALAGGADLEDALKVGLITGGLSYGGGALNNMDASVDFNNMTADQIDEALQTNLVKDLKEAGVTNPSEFLTGQGGNAAKYIQESVAATDLATNLANQGMSSGEIAQVLDSVGFVPTAVSDALESVLTTPVTSLLPSVIETPVSSITNVLDTAPVETVNVATQVPQQVSQNVIDLVNSQIASNVATPVTEQVVTSNKPTTVQEVVNAITSTLPEITTNQAQAIAEQVVTSNKPVTTQEIVNAITSTLPTAVLPTVTTPVTPEQVVTAEKPVTNQQIIDAITSVIPSTPTPAIPTETTVAEQVITNSRPVANEDIVSTIVSNIPTPVTATPEVSVTAEKPITIQDVINAVTNLVPTTPVVNPTVVTPEQVITAEKPVTTKDVVNSIVSTIPTTSVVTPEQVITDQKPVTTQDVINSIIASVPTTTTPVVPEQTVIAQKPSSIPDVIPTVIPTITPSVPLAPTEIKPAEKTTKEPDPIKVAQTALQAVSLLGAGNAVANAATNTGGNQYPIIPIPSDWTSPLPTGIAPYTPLEPIDFGNRDLLKGTQWEKFLSPTYGQPQQFVRYSQPTGMSYSDLMGILGNKQSPARSNLTISDIISGIQNQYG